MKFLYVFFIYNALASPPPRGTTQCTGDCDYNESPLGVYGAHEAISQRAKLEPLTEKSIPRRAPKSHAKNLSKNESNMPSYYQGMSRSHFEAREGGVLVVKNARPLPPGLRAGDMLKALITQSIKASPSVPTPVRAQALSGPSKGSYFLGEAKFDPELKRVLLTFNTFRDSSNETYSVHAVGLSPSGEVGLEGEHHTDSGRFFLAELAVAGTAAITDSTITRNPTSRGTWVEEPSLANTAKHGAVAALTKTTERMAEKVRSAPEYTYIPAPQHIQILVQELETTGAAQ